MSYVIDKKNAQEIYRSGVEDIRALTTMDSVAESSTLAGIMRAFANRSAELYDSIEANFFAGYTRTATGPWLDALAEDWGLSRFSTSITRVPCTSNTIYLQTKDQTSLYGALGVGGTPAYAVLPKGLVITSEAYPDTVIITDETSIITPTSTSVSLGASGILNSGIRLPAGTFNGVEDITTSFPSASLSNLEIVQVKTIIGVETIESDDSLRSRIEQALNSAASGNEAAVFNALAPYPEVADFFVDRNIRGTGSADIIVFPRFERVPEAILDQIRTSMLSTAAFGTDIKVVEPDIVPVSMELRVEGTIADTAIINGLENIVKSTNRKTLSHSVLTSEMSQRGYTVMINRLSINNRTVLPSAEVTIFPTEMFQMRPRNTSEKAITIV